jgi:RNA polymerase sigma factor (sigma-70 family)
MTENDIRLDLWKRCHSGDRLAREELILFYAPLVSFWVSKISKQAPYASRHDLLQEGTKGLLNAVDRFDPNKEAEFSTFARHFIVGEIMSASEFTRGVGRRQFEIHHKALRAHDALAAKLRRKPTVEEVAEEANMTAQQVQDAFGAIGIAFAAGSDSITLVLQGSREGFERLQGLVKSGELSSIAGSTVQAIQKEEPEPLDRIQIKELLSTLPSKEQLILVEYYWSGRTDAEIASKLGLTLSNVRKARQRALTKLRSQFETK